MLLYRKPLTALLTLAWTDDRYTHLPLIPLITIVLIFFQRRRTFLGSAGLRSPGVLAVVVGTALTCLALAQIPAPEAALPLAILGIVLSWIGGFIFFYRTGPFKTALFPLSLLLLFIPLPTSFVESAQVALQWASAEVTYLLFRLAGTPVLRQGLVFSLPGVDIEVARECSGIRSTTALLITALVLGHLFLRPGWRQACFVLVTIPIAVLKNAVRIAILSWLGVYVSRDYLLGQVHHYSGLPVSALGFCLMIPALLLLQRSERRRSGQSALTTVPPPPSPESSRHATE